MTTLRAINHLAFISHDLPKTIRFYRDLLGMPLSGGIGREGYRHYFFAAGESQIAFFAYDGAAPMPKKPHGTKTTEARGFDHVSFDVASCAELFRLKDRLVAAGVEVTGPIDHGLVWSIYFFDPDAIPLEVSWSCVDLLTTTPVIDDDAPLSIAEEGAEPRPELWPEVVAPTPPDQWRAKPGNGHELRERLVAAGAARLRLASALHREGA